MRKGTISKFIENSKLEPASLCSIVAANKVNGKLGETSTYGALKFRNVHPPWLASVKELEKRGWFSGDRMPGERQFILLETRVPFSFNWQRGQLFSTARLSLSAETIIIAAFRRLN